MQQCSVVVERVKSRCLRPWVTTEWVNVRTPPPSFGLSNLP